MSWFFGSSSPSSVSSTREDLSSHLSESLQPLPPPPPPLKGVPISSAPFTGFSDPPPSPSAPTGAPRGPPLSLSFKTQDYNSEDFSHYTSPYAETSGVNDLKYAAEYLERQRKAPSWLDEHVQNPRLRGCIDSVKMGMKMGCAVGGIFGGLTGTYAAFTNRNFLILPLSVVGGALSFGFFLGCGMVIRCEEPRGPMRPQGFPGYKAGLSIVR